MERNLPDPLKQMRQKQAAYAKLLATQTRKRERMSKEQDNIRAVEVAEKQASKERLKAPPPLEDTTSKVTPPDPSQTKETNPEILLEAGQTKRSPPWRGTLKKTH
jgi:hypothetical protein